MDLCLSFQYFFFLFNGAIYPKRKSPHSEAFPTHLALAVFQGWMTLLLCVGHIQSRVLVYNSTVEDCPAPRACS